MVEPAVFDYRSVPRWQGFARQAGAEAFANGRSHMNANDRLDIAYSYGVTDWKDIPTADQDKAREMFQAGVRAERAWQKCN